MSKTLFVFSFVLFLSYSCIATNSCTDVSAFSFGQAVDQADVILKAKVLSQQACGEKGDDYSEFFIEQECVYATGGSSMVANTQGGTPKHLIRAIDLCNLDTNESYLFFLKQRPSVLFDQALYCDGNSLTEVSILYAGETDFILLFNEEAEAEVVELTGTKSCARASSSTASPATFAGFCNCTSQEQDHSLTKHDQIDPTSRDDNVVIVVDRVVNISIVEEEPAGQESVIVVDRVTDISQEASTLLDYDDVLLETNNLDENGDATNQIAVLGSAILAAVTLAIFSL